MNILVEKLSVAIVGGAIIALGGAGTAQAFSFTESVDAGETLGTAQVVNTQLPETVLTSIIGSTSSEDNADLFKIFLSAGQTFSATTEGGASFDTQLFLFNADGFGVEANDDTDINSFQSTLPLSGFSPTHSGIYYIGISGYDYDPVSSEGLIFPNASFEGVEGPTGPGGESPLAGFAGDGVPPEFGSYTITITGAQAVPEPSSILSLLAFGAFSVRAMLGRKLNKCKS